MIFVSIRLIEGCIVAKSALIAGIGDRNALFDGMVCQIEAFFCYIFSNSIPGFVTKQVHQIGTVQKGSVRDSIDGQIFGQVSIDIVKNL